MEESGETKWRNREKTSWTNQGKTRWRNEEDTEWRKLKQCIGKPK